MEQQTITAIQHLKAEKLEVSIYSNRADMGRAAAQSASSLIVQLLKSQEHLNIIFAAAPSQNEFLDALTATNGIDWGRINAFHMDEYIGLPEDVPQKFGNFLKERIFEKVSFRSVHYLNGSARNPEAECDRYSSLLTKYPVDIVFMGIGENTHIAFNDPHVADFNDQARVKVVDLDMACRQQQVNDACFALLSEVPTHAYTLTIPSLMAARFIYCMVPGANKAAAVRHTLQERIMPDYPSTILRRHPHAWLFLDRDSAGMFT